MMMVVVAVKWRTKRYTDRGRGGSLEEDQEVERAAKKVVFWEDKKEPLLSIDRSWVVTDRVQT